ncbi:MAG: response regulator transcription factor [Rhodospirillaceae bacterium]|nr:response regulator transcription factor [Rhodospirillaceae bacterium]MBT4487750.1 response regulator transcription factor [Rhodospirillaceae bacterium]MBT5191012.1 response regulator transcription factor [Rhodospirillaceae bacterium]MBT5894505.1 response regulator transcription factor [Rhodospirillaceae bacterium]MBT6429850.1 response regulator transcription factor [Rhodospirillaceae bacterium]
MTQYSVLLIEDDLFFARDLTRYLVEQGFDAATVGDSAEMFKAIDARGFDCFVVDLTLPDEDGIVLIRKLRSRSNAPIIVLTGRDGIEDKSASFELGADDYLTKPIDPRELVMRLNSNLNRSAGAGVKSGDILHVGDFVIDRARHEAHGPGGVAIKFTLAELHLIWVLAEADGKVMSRDVLIDAISDGEGPETFRAIDVTVSRVRKKLGKDAVVTVFNKGYKCGLSVARPG